MATEVLELFIYTVLINDKAVPERVNAVLNNLSTMRTFPITDANGCLLHLIPERSG